MKLFEYLNRQTLLTLCLTGCLSGCIQEEHSIDTATPSRNNVIYVEPGDELEFEVTGPVYGDKTKGDWKLIQETTDENESVTETTDLLTPSTTNPFALTFETPDVEIGSSYKVVYTVYKTEWGCHNPFTSFQWCGFGWAVAKSVTWTLLSGYESQNPPSWIGDLYINNADDISMLDGFEVIQGDLHFSREAKLDGATFSTLKTVEGSLNIRFNQTISTLSSLHNIEQIKGDLDIVRNTNLSTLEGLGSTQIDGHISIQFNKGLTSLDGLNRTIPMGRVSIFSNPDLTTLRGLETMTLHDSLRVEFNPSLTSLEGMENLEVNGLLRFQANHNLTSLTGFNGTQLNGSLVILNHEKLPTLMGLETLHTIKGGLYINSNPNMISLNGLNNLTSVEGDISIRDNDKLATLSDLENLTSVGDKVTIKENYMLDLSTIPDTLK